MTTMILICGNDGVGKTTTGKYLAAHTGLCHCETSDTVYKEYARRNGVSEKYAKWLPKPLIRQQLRDIGDELTDKNPIGLAWPLIEGGCRILSGIRRAHEVEAILNKIESVTKKSTVKTHIIWIDSPKPVDPKDNTQIAVRSMADVLLYNDLKNIDNLYKQLNSLMTLWYQSGELHNGFYDQNYVDKRKASLNEV